MQRWYLYYKEVDMIVCYTVYNGTGGLYIEVSFCLKYREKNTSLTAQMVFYYKEVDMIACFTVYKRTILHKCTVLLKVLYNTTCNMFYLNQNVMCFISVIEILFAKNIQLGLLVAFSIQTFSHINREGQINIRYNIGLCRVI